MPPDAFTGAPNPEEDSPTAAAFPPDEQRPLLTIAIPTFNRAARLAALLAVLEPQVSQFPQVAVLVCDNASDDETPAVTAEARERFAAAGAQLEVVRHDQNIGSDANFVFCYHRARGRFFWLCGDDDIIVPGALAMVVPHLRGAQSEAADIDLIYATSYGYRDDFERERHGDPLGRHYHTVTDPRDFAMAVNIMFTFISGMIVNKERLESMPHEDPQAFIGTNLVQLSWSLPLLLRFRKGLVLWERPVAARQGNAHGYSLGHVFGERLAANVARLLPGRGDLQATILNVALRRWFPSVLIDVRAAHTDTLELAEAHVPLRRAFGRNPRYWLFTWPALMLPLPVAKPYTKASAAFSKLLYMVHLPGFWRKQT